MSTQQLPILPSLKQAKIQKPIKNSLQRKKILIRHEKIFFFAFFHAQKTFSRVTFQMNVKFSKLGL